MQIFDQKLLDMHQDLKSSQHRLKIITISSVMITLLTPIMTYLFMSMFSSMLIKIIAMLWGVLITILVWVGTHAINKSVREQREKLKNYILFESKGSLGSSK